MSTNARSRLGHVLVQPAVVALCAALALVVIAPRPASAALLAQFRTAVTGVSPSVAGLTAKSVTNGESITVTNRTGKTLIVEGYQHEPYLKITEAGVWQNKVSPATYLNKEQTIGTLGDMMQLDSGTLSPLVRRLEKSGFVTKSRSSADERIVTVRLTDEGHALRAEVAPIRTQIARLAGIGDDEHRRRLIAELQQLTALLQNSDT